MYINFSKIDELISQGYISQTFHDYLDLRILNYTDKTMYDNFWTKETKICRGLVVNSNNEIISLPFEKFFNYTDTNNIHIKDISIFDVYEKLDGSLGILVQYKNNKFICTRGSFNGLQALKATEILLSKYNNIVFDTGITYMFEIIYPENRIVINYNNTEDIFLLGARRTKTGEDIHLDNINLPIPRVKKYILSNIQDVENIVRGEDALKIVKKKKALEKEGFVVRYSCGTRVKYKNSLYFKLHKLISQITPMFVWELLSSNNNIDNELYECLPDENKDLFDGLRKGMLEKFNNIKNICKGEYIAFDTRKETAIYIKEKGTYPSVLFAILSEKDLNKAIWKVIKHAVKN